MLALDTETNGVHWHADAFCVSWATDTAEGIFWLDEPGAKESCRDFISCYDTWVFHVAKFDLSKLIKLYGWDIVNGRTIHDTHILYHLLDENRDNSLKQLAIDVLGHEDNIEVEIKSGPNKGQKRLVPREQYEIKQALKEKGLPAGAGFEHVPREVLEPYAIKDARFTYDLHVLGREVFPSEFEEVYQLEMELIPHLILMENNGTHVDLARVNDYIEMYQHSIDTLLIEIRNEVEDEDFNPNSTQQIQKFVKERFKKDMDSTDKAAVEKAIETGSPKLAEFLKSIQKLRELNKTLNTYFIPLKEEVRSDGVFHPYYKNTVRTGRMASGAEKFA